MRQKIVVTFKVQVPLIQKAKSVKMASKRKIQTWMAIYCQIFPICLEAADDVCVKLDHLVRNGTISKNDIFYKHIKDVVYFFINPRTHQYDNEVIEFFNTIRHLGGESTVNFVRGPAWHG